MCVLTEKKKSIIYGLRINNLFDLFNARINIEL